VTETRHSITEDPRFERHEGRRYTVISVDDDAASSDEEFITGVVHNETMRPREASRVGVI